jgi:outer membrane protein assembly factor BamB
MTARAFPPIEEPHAGSLVPWASAGLLLIALLAAYRWIDTRDYQADEDALTTLRNAALAPAEVAASVPGEWPQWRGPNRDGISLETGFRTDWPADGPPVRWQVPSGKGFSSLVVSRGRVYTLVQERAHEAVVCWDADNGQEVWRVRYPERVVLDHGDGPRATPAIDSDRLYAIGAGGVFHCLNAATGEVLWRHDLMEEFGGKELPWRPTYWGHACSPFVEGDRVFTLTGGPQGAVAAFDKRTGRLLWKALDDPAGYSSPIAITVAGVRQVVFFTGRGLVGLAPADGAVLWRYPWETNDFCNIATPIARGSYLFISSGYDRGCALLELVHRDDGSWAVRRVYGHRRYRNHFATSVLYREHLYGFDNATLACMEFRTGKVTWRQNGFGKGTLLLADGHLIILGENGRLALADADPHAYVEKAACKVSDGRCWTVPVLAGGRLYVRDEEHVTCLDLRKP